MTYDKQMDLAVKKREAGIAVLQMQIAATEHKIKQIKLMKLDFLEKQAAKFEREKEKMNESQVSI